MRARGWRQVLAVSALALVSLWLVSLIIGLAQKAQIAIRQAREAETAYRDLEARKATLEVNIAASETPRGQDAAIRTAFGVARSGEEVIVVVPSASATATPPLPWLERLFNWF
ncbi:hypothetical protein HY091_02760 [Candidatus Kaiserbacteria bacterium]|nr:hypothetical protein [Candidatus Kaiserbacteria bacterium]